MTECVYIPNLQIDFGLGITAEQLNAEFQAIEEAMGCLGDAIDEMAMNEETFYDYGEVSGTVYINPAFGINQKMLIHGHVQLIILTPAEGDPVLINLLIGEAVDLEIAEAGAARFNFGSGSSWASDVHGSDSMDGKPWYSAGLGGDYGSVTICLYDGVGWLHLVHARHDIDPDEDPRLVDIYNWR